MIPIIKRESDEGKMGTAAGKSTKSAAARSPAKTASVKGMKTAEVKGTRSAPVSVLDGSAPAPAAKPAAEPSVVEAAQSVILGPVMRKKELIDAVVERSGIKKKDAKPVVEAMLAVLGDALAEKRELNLQPLGRVMVRREKQMANGRMLVTKIRQAGNANAGSTPDDDA